MTDRMNDDDIDLNELRSAYPPKELRTSPRRMICRVCLRDLTQIEPAMYYDVYVKGGHITEERRYDCPTCHTWHYVYYDMEDGTFDVRNWGIEDESTRQRYNDAPLWMRSYVFKQGDSLSYNLSYMDLFQDIPDLDKMKIGEMRGDPRGITLFRLSDRKHKSAAPSTHGATVEIVDSEKSVQRRARRHLGLLGRR